MTLSHDSGIKPKTSFRLGGAWRRITIVGNSSQQMGINSKTKKKPSSLFLKWNSYLVLTIVWSAIDYWLCGISTWYQYSRTLERFHTRWCKYSHALIGPRQCWIVINFFLTHYSSSQKNLIQEPRWFSHF